MEYLNEISKEENPSDFIYLETLLILLTPFAPYITEEIWQLMGHGESIHEEPWPAYDEKYLQKAAVKLIVQVNGKVRDVIEISPKISREEATKLAMRSPNVQKHIGTKSIRNVVVVPGKLVNIVV